MVANRTALHCFLLKQRQDSKLYRKLQEDLEDIEEQARVIRSEALRISEEKRALEAQLSRVEDHNADIPPADFAPLLEQMNRIKEILSTVAVQVEVCGDLCLHGAAGPPCNGVLCSFALLLHVLCCLCECRYTAIQAKLSHTARPKRRCRSCRPPFKRRLHQRTSKPLRQSFEGRKNSTTLVNLNLRGPWMRGSRQWC